MGGKTGLAAPAAALPESEPEEGGAGEPAEACSGREPTASGAAINSASESVGMLPCAAGPSAADSRARGFTARGGGADPGSGVDTKRCSTVAVAAAAEKSTSST